MQLRHFHRLRKSRGSSLFKGKEPIEYEKRARDKKSNGKYAWRCAFPETSGTGSATAASSAGKTGGTTAASSADETGGATAASSADETGGATAAPTAGGTGRYAAETPVEHVFQCRGNAYDG
jgi:hypothetical protein